MPKDHDDPAGPDGRADHATGRSRPPLRRVDGPVAAGEPPPPVRLVREYKGLTVADLLRPDLAARLPGQVRSALHRLERGDFAAAEQALPGHFAPVVAGPWRSRSRWPRWSWWVVGAALLGGLAWRCGGGW